MKCISSESALFAKLFMDIIYNNLENSICDALMYKMGSAILTVSICTNVSWRNSHYAVNARAYIIKK